MTKLNTNLSNRQTVVSNKLLKSSYSLSQVEENIIYLVLGRMNSKLEVSSTEFYSVDVEEYAVMKGISVKDAYEVVKSAVDTLFERVITIPCDKGYVKTRWISSIEFSPDLKEIRIMWAPKLLPYISQLKDRFTRLPTMEMVQIDGSYAKRLAQLIFEGRNIVSKYTGGRSGEIELSLKEIYKQWCVPPSCLEYKYFKQAILVPAMKEVERKTGLVLLLVDKESRCKSGRRVERVWVGYGL